MIFSSNIGDTIDMTAHYMDNTFDDFDLMRPVRTSEDEDEEVAKKKNEDAKPPSNGIDDDLKSDEEKEDIDDDDDDDDSSSKENKGFTFVQIGFWRI